MSIFAHLFTNPADDSDDPRVVSRNNIMDAMTEYYVARQGAQFIGEGIMPRLFPSQSDKRRKQIDELDILERKARLGLPTDTGEYEDLLNEHKTLANPGTALKIGLDIFRNPNKPILNLGSNPFMREFDHVKPGRGVLGKWFR